MRNYVVLICLMLIWPSSVLALVNINTASLEELDTLPNVGPATAEAIVAGRPYSGIAEIQRISGFKGGPGTKNYEDIIGLITVSGATTVVVEDDESPEVAKVNSSNTKSEKKIVPPITSLHISAPDFAFVNQPIEFSVEPSDGRKDRLVRYHWSFGDANTGDLSSLTHQYRYPGKYVVIVESTYLKEQEIARHEIEILPVNLTLQVSMAGEVTVTNNSDEEINIHGMVLQTATPFVFPNIAI